MSYNTGHEKWKSNELANLDCGYNLKIAALPHDTLMGTYEPQAGRVLAVGECVAMIRVKAGTEILGAELYWGPRLAATCVPTTVLAVGDPFCCGRLLGPVNTLYARGALTASCGGLISIWGACGTLQKSNTLISDGCGIGYVYTCETDIVLTNLYDDGFAFDGGHPGAHVEGSQAGAALTSGVFKLIVKVRQP